MSFSIISNKSEESKLLKQATLLKKHQISILNLTNNSKETKLIEESNNRIYIEDYSVFKITRHKLLDL